MWLAPCMGQGMFTQRLASDPKFKLNISSFVTLTYPLDCLIYAKNIMIISCYYI